MNELRRFFYEYISDEGRRTYKMKSYEPVYETFLSRYIGRDVTIVEVGIGYGGSLQMWRSYLGPLAKVYGIDKDETSCYSDQQIITIVGDQADNEFVKSIPHLIPNIDIFVDDGSHINSHQIATFESVFPKMNIGGLYFCEDVHTSYRPGYGGGYHHEGSFIEYCKSLIDSLNHLEHGSETPSFINQIESISFWRSLVMIKKAE